MEKQALILIARLLILALTGLALPLSAGFTLRDILSAPLVYDLSAAPKGDAFAWVMEVEGVRNIWIARGPAFVPVTLTSFTADDGQDLGNLAWLPDTSGLLFTRGGGANGKGEFPNPKSLPEGVRQEIWMATSGAAARKIADGRAPAISPDGKIAAWVKSGDIWSVDLPSTRAPEQLTHARGSASDLTWSPDSTRIAYTSDRGDHSFIGVYNFRDKSLTYPDPAADLDQSPSWSPDGSQLAFIRIPGSRYANAWGPKRTGLPWSIRIAGKEVWKSREGLGSVFWPMSATRQLLWSPQGRIIFPWEGDGWLHLYSLPTTGGAPALLTPGNFEIENASLSIDGKSVVFSSNQNDIDRRHLWTVPLAGGPPTQLTNSKGVEARPLALNGDAVAFVRTEATQSQRIAIREAAGTQRDLTTTLNPAGLIAPDPVEFTSADGIRIHAQLFRPTSPATGKHPAMIFIHGGSRRQMVLSWQYSLSYYSQTYAFNQYLANQGYVVLSVNYRSGTGYGERFREALNYGATGGSEYADIVAAGKYLQTRQDVNAKKIGLWGGSYGGYLTAMGLAKNSDMFAVGVDLHGVHDWNLEITNYIPMYEPEKRQALSTTAFRSSPMAYVSTWKSPVLLIHGDDDRNVIFSQTVLLEEQLRKQKVPFEELIFPDEIHEFLLHAHWLQAYQTAADFIAKHLK